VGQDDFFFGQGRISGTSTVGKFLVQVQDSALAAILLRDPTIEPVHQMSRGAVHQQAMLDIQGAFVIADTAQGQVELLVVDADVNLDES